MSPSPSAPKRPKHPGVTPSTAGSDWRNVQAEVEPAPPAIHPLAIALGVLMLSLGAMIWIGDKEPEEKPIMAELRRQRLLNMVRR
jgi:hypothetical protein